MRIAMLTGKPSCNTGGIFMSRKTLISILLISVILVFNMLLYAEPGDGAKKEDAPVFELVKNPDGMKTFERDLIISAKSKEDTTVVLYHYWFKVDEEKSIIAKKKTSSTGSESGEWCLVTSDESTIGASGIYAKQISLKIGKNKIVLRIKDKDGNRKIQVMNMERMDKEELTNYINNMILRNVDTDI